MFLYSTKSSQLSFMEKYHKETLAKARAHTFPYHSYTQEEINAYNTVNLVHLCIYISENAISYQAGKLVVRSAPHVIIYPEGFYDTKSRKCYTAVNGLKAFFGFDFLQALYIIKSYFESEALFHMDDYVNEHYPLVFDSCLATDYNLNYALKYNLLDRKDNNSLKMVYSVLHNRMHIERDVITKFLRTKKLIVYGGFDLCFLEYLDDNVIAVTRKLQNKDHMATEVMTVKRNTTFTWDNDSSLYYSNVYIFEDVYQIMSYLSLIEKNLVPQLVKNNIMLSLNGMSFDALKGAYKKELCKDDIFICLSSGSVRHVGKVAYIPEDMEYYAGGFMGLLRKKDDLPPDKNISVRYVHALLSSNTFREYLSEISKGKGSNIKNLNDSIGDIKLPFPPFEIQKKIENELILAEKENNYADLREQILSKYLT